MSSTDPLKDNHDKTIAEEKPPFEWTVLVYMAGDNNLSEECVYALTEIREALKLNDNPRLAVAAQFDPSGVRAATKRYRLGAGNSLDDDAKKTGWKARETDSGEFHNLLEFLRWGLAEYPAEHNMVVLVGHGTGTDNDFLRDDSSQNSLTIIELREIFANLTMDGHTIDILGMDTCLMSMAEVCYELFRNKVTYMVGSEGFAPNTGWPYRSILSYLSKQIPTDGKPSPVTPEWLANSIVNMYREFYEPYINGGISVDQSALKIANIEGVQKTLFSLVRYLKGEFEKGQLEYRSPKQNALILAHWEAQSYNGEVFVDLYDFCDRLQLRFRDKDKNVDDLCGDVKKAIDLLVVNSQVAGAAFQFSFGLSIYFPWAALTPKYNNLSFPKATNWIDFLQFYLNKTRRRRDDQKKPESGGADTVPTATQSVLDTPPVRSTVPINKGRTGNIESMRNPATEEFVGTNLPELVAKTETKATGPKTSAGNGGQPKRTLKKYAAGAAGKG